MRFLENFVETPIAGPIGWTLLHSFWEGAIVSAVLAAVLLAVRSPRARYAAACAAMLVMLAGFGLILLWLLAGASQRCKERVSAPVLSGQSLPRVRCRSALGSKPCRNRALVRALLDHGSLPFLSMVFGELGIRRTNAPAGRVLRRRPLAKQACSLSAQLRVSRPVLLLESCFAEVPVVLGHFRPLILLSIGLLAGPPPAQMEAVLVHELAHIRRSDYLMNLLQRFAEGLLFYHPAVWWFARVMPNEQEKCCDDVVASVTGEAREYALTLVALEQSRFRGQTAIAVTGGNLMKRIHRLLYPKPSSAPWSTLLAVAVFFATACASVAAWQSEPSKQSSAASQSLTGSSSIRIPNG